MATSAPTYRKLKRSQTCTRCRRRRARKGKTKCGVCARALKPVDAIGARRRKYGATPADVRRLVDEQGGRCPICGRRVDDRSALDHEHETGDLRGLLCQTPCNSSIVGRTDADLFRTTEGLARYARKRRKTLIMRQCNQMRSAA